MKDYSNEPYFVKKAEKATAFKRNTASTKAYLHKKGK